MLIGYENEAVVFMSKKKVMFCWSDISGYMATCWRSLHNSPDIDVYVIAFQALTETAFTDDLMDGIPSHLLNLEERNNAQLIRELVTKQSPDVIVFCGWLHQPYTKLAFDRALEDSKKIMAMDTPWWGTWKQYFAPIVLRSFLSKIDHVVVTGERSWQYAIRLEFKSGQITRGVYGIDYDKWCQLYEKRNNHPWPKSFLFVGRYGMVKAIDILVEGYEIYRGMVPEPWKLVCCGKGELENLLEGKSGIENKGFVQPSVMEEIWINAGAFILPSRFDPWPLALVEAAASGLPIVCTDVCGSAVEVLRPLYNGLMIPPDDPLALAKALQTIHQNYQELPMWGVRSQQLAQPYSAQMWVKRWREIL